MKGKIESVQELAFASKGKIKFSCLVTGDLLNGFKQCFLFPYAFDKNVDWISIEVKVKEGNKLKVEFVWKCIHERLALRREVL